MKILVTGATGFIGARIVDALLKAPNKYDLHFSGRQMPRDSNFVTRGARFIQGDLTDAEFSRQATEGVDTIIHCAGLAGTWGPYQEYQRANVLATRNLLEGAKTTASRFVNISSPSIYFDYKDQFQLKETELPKKFSNAYARTKYEAEVLVQEYHSSQLQTVSLRPRSVIGAGDQNIIPRILRLQRSGQLIQVGDGENRVDVTSIGNLIDAIHLCLDAPASAMGETYNITNGQPILFWQFVDEVLAAAGLPAQRRHLPYGPVMAMAVLNQWYREMIHQREEPAFLPIAVGAISFSMTLDISKAREKLGYRPRFSVRDGIEEFFARK